MKMPNGFYRVSAKAVVEKDDRFLLLREKDGYWDFPGGGVEHGEGLIEGLSREIKEELGVEPKDIKPKPLLIIKGLKAGVHKVYIFYSVSINEEDEINFSGEINDSRYVTKQEMESLNLDPIVDKNKTELIKHLFNVYK